MLLLTQKESLEFIFNIYGRLQENLRSISPISDINLYFMYMARSRSGWDSHPGSLAFHIALIDGHFLTF